MPRPKVKAIGALVMKTSPGFGPTRCFAKVSHGASTSRWNWTQPFGTPVVPLVKAMMHGSSRPVSAGGSGCKRGGARLQLALPVIAVIFDDVLDAVRLLDRLAEVADEAAVDDRVADLRALDHRRDLARAKQRHGRDHHAAGLQHAEPGREHRVAVRPAQEHAVAGDQPVLLDQQPRDAPAEIVELGIGPAAMVVDDRERVRRAAFQQLRRGVQPLGILQLGQVEAELRQQLRRRKRSRRSVVRHPSLRAKRGLGGSLVASLLDENHSSTTAVVSISTLAALSTRPFTSTSAIAG